VENYIPAISETRVENKLSDRELKSNCFLYARSSFQGRAFINESIGKAITVSRGGISEWQSATKSRDQILSIKILDKLLQQGDFWKEEADKRNDPNIAKVIYLRQICQINDNLYTAIMTIKAYKMADYHKFYHYYLDDLMVE
jgi:hypothetical protein